MKFPLTYCLLCLTLYAISVLVVCAEVQTGSILRPSDRPPLWSSPNNSFTFGFYSSGNEGLYVVGIAFANINETTLVWTAGRGAPVNQGAQLRFQSDGDLVLLNGTGSQVWKSGTANKGVVSALMGDDGNLVLKNRSSGKVWESFNNPTDTLLVGQVFTVGQTLSTGYYSFSFDYSGNLSLKWQNNITYWNVSFSQPFSLLKLSLNDQGIFSLTDYTNSTSSQLWLTRSSDYTDISVTVRRITLDSDGNLRAYGWHGTTQSWQVGWSAVEDQCQVYGWCGNSGICVYNQTAPYCICPSLDFAFVDPKDPMQGCERKENISSCPSNQSMVMMNHTEFLSYPPESSSDKFFLGFTDCRQNCLNNPTCSASTILSDGSGTCRLKTSNFTSGYQSAAIPSTSYVKVCGPGRPTPLLSPPPPTTETTRKLSSLGIILAVIGTVIGLIIFETGLWWACWRNSRRFRNPSAQYTLLEYASGAPVQFSYKELQQATKDFKDKVGSGGFGTVYKGTLSNKTIVAVKKLEGIEQGEKQFRMEVATIGSTHHLNLAKLIGFCSERRHRLLVYEFMKNTSLDNFLFASADDSSKKLDWDARFGIALGTARGITYLHEECRDCIIHCDIKPENILLDDNFNAKVSDFGLARLINVREHQNRALTSVMGTRGYLAPEWLANLPITSKSDVFSYGMVLLELVGGRRNFDISANSGRRKFSTWAFEQFELGNISSIVDERLGGNINMGQVQRAIQVSFWCIQEQSSRRPSMGKVVQMLEGVLPIERPPAPKSFEGHQSSASVSTNDSRISVLATSPSPLTSSSSRYAFERSDSQKNTEEILSSGR